MKKSQSDPKPAPKKTAAPAVAFPKKNQPPSPAAFAARLPLSLGKRLEMARTFLLKQKGVREDLYYYGPKTGWALRYLLREQPLCSLVLHEESPMGIVSLDAAATDTVDWKALSNVARTARKNAHGSPAMQWLDIPLAGTGAADFKAILRVKLATLGGE